MLRSPVFHRNALPDAAVARLSSETAGGLFRGGRWVQLLRIKPAFEHCEVTFVTVHESYRAQVPGHNSTLRWTKLGILPASD